MKIRFIIIFVMANESHSEYQYNRCSSRGICSINPTTSALQEIILLLLRHTACYGLNFYKKGIKNLSIKKLILNTISVLSSDYEISEANFYMILNAFKNELPLILKDYEEVDSDKDFSDLNNIIYTDMNLNDYIRFGEKEFNSRISSIPSDERGLYRILFILVKSLGMNIMTFENYEESCFDFVVTVYEIFNLLNTPKKNKNELKNIAEKLAETDCSLMIKIRDAQEKRYGIQDEAEVSFSTEKGKALLVVGSELSELEHILKVFDEEEADIYTHDNMILAHTFPEFRKYKNLKGQYGQGMENCLLDFSTFPGPIILTRNSLFNAENLYRGRLFTTDIACSKGIIQIKNNNFSELLESLKNSRGFKTGKKCPSEKIGFKFQDIAEKTEKMLSEGVYKKAVIIGPGGYTQEEKEYFDSFMTHLKDDLPAISMSCCEPKENQICLNLPGDICSFLKISKTVLKNEQIKTSVFIPYAERHMLSVIIFLNSHKNTRIFAGKWNRTFLGSDIFEALSDNFGVFEISTPKKDLRLTEDF